MNPDTDITWKQIKERGCRFMDGMQAMEIRRPHCNGCKAEKRMRGPLPDF